MPSFRASAVAAGVAAFAAAAVLTGCSTSLSAVAPPGARLAGDWRLDPSRSDDLGRALIQLHEQAERRAREMRRTRMAGTAGDGDGSTGERRTRGGPEGSEGGERGRSQSPTGEVAIGPGPSVSAADELMASVPQGDFLRITASPGTFTVTSGASSAQYTPGLPSDISAQQGYAQQISGWKGADYVVDTKPQWGPEIIQSYGVTKDGRLKLTVRLVGRGTQFAFTRIYDRTTRVSPLAPPTND